MEERSREPLLEEEAFVQLQRTADAYLQQAASLLRGYGLSATQYNVLRILRGAGEEGLPCGEIGNRMITRDPDITRLLDRLEARGWVRRERRRRDRRVVITRISDEGLEMMSKLDEPVRTMHREKLGAMGEERLRELITLLEQVRRLVSADA